MKSFALILVLFLLVFACGCQSASLSGGGATEPSNTEPTQAPTDPTEATQATDPTEPTEIVKTPIAFVNIVESDSHIGDPGTHEMQIKVIRSVEECSDWLLEELTEKVDAFDDRYFDNHTVVWLSDYAANTGEWIKVTEAFLTDDGGLFLNVDHVFEDMGGESICTTYAIVAIEYILPEAADVQVEVTNVLMTYDEFNDYFGESGC